MFWNTSLCRPVTLLSILGNGSIAVPLSSGFPSSELRYILENSEAVMLLSSAKFQSKAQEVMSGELKKKPIFGTIEKILEGSQAGEGVDLEDSGNTSSGMMLYTSGTTSRPVCILTCRSGQAYMGLERGAAPRACSNSTGSIPYSSMEI